MTLLRNRRLVTQFPTAFIATTAATVTAACLLVAGVWLARDTLQGVIQCFEINDTITEAELAVGSVRSTLKDAETGQRGFLLTGDLRYLAPYETARDRIGLDLAVLGGASLGDPERRRRIVRIQTLATMKMAELSKTLAYEQSGQHQRAIDEVRSNLGKNEMDAVRVEADALQADSAARVANARERTQSTARWAAVIGFGVLATMLMGWVAVVQRRAGLRAAASQFKLDRFSRAFGLTQGIILDLDGRILFWSDGAERLYGYGQTEALGHIIHDLLRTGFPVPVSEIMATVLRDGHWSGELEHYHRDGTRVFTASYWALHRGEADEALSIIKVNNDITVLKDIETELRRSELAMRLAVEASSQGVWRWEIGSGTPDVEWDARCKTIFGLHPGAPVNFDVWACRVDVDDRSAAEAGVMRALDPGDGNDEYASQYRIRHPDGETRWIESYGRALFEPAPDEPAQRRPVCIMGTMRDVSATKFAERQRERDAALLRAIVEAVPGLIYAKDLQGRILVANGLTMDLLGKPWFEVEGRTDAELLDDPAQAAAVMQSDRRIIEQGQAETLEEFVDTPDGRTRVWLSTKTPLRGADDQIIGLVGLSIDITERKRIEDRCRVMIDELNHRVKNTLVTVQAIALQTLGDVNPETRRALERRLFALASAHDVLTRESWEGAALGDVVAMALIPFGIEDRGRILSSGPELHLCPRAALAIAMGLHELATNALKYGALSTDRGLVEVRWEISSAATPLLRLTWTERDGPPVVRPTHKGFGVRLIERTLAQDLGGTARISFDDAAGVTCVLEVPLHEVAASVTVVALPRVGPQQAVLAC